MKYLLLLGSFTAALLLARVASAEGGYFSGTVGARAAGRAGAFAAKADDVSAVYHNPAGLANIESTQIEVVNQISYNPYSFSRASTVDYGHASGGEFPTVSFAKVSNGKAWQGIVPFLGVASKLGLKDWAFALSVYAPPGVGNMSFPLAPYSASSPPNLSNPQPDGQRYMMVDREAIFLKYVGSLAWKYNDVFGLGVSAEWIHVPRLRYTLIVDGTPFSNANNPVYSDLDIKATMKGSSLFTFNAIVGAWYRPVPSLTLALAGQVVPTSMVLNGNLAVQPMNREMGDFELKRGGQNADDVKVTLPLPLVARAAVRYRGLVNSVERFDVELDVEYVTWSRVKEWTIDTVVGGKPLVTRYENQNNTINPIHIVRQWQDTIAVRLGGDYVAIPGMLSLRAGAYYESAVAKPEYTAVDFTTAFQLGGAVGASLFVGGVELLATYALKLQPTVKVSESAGRVYQQVPAPACEAPYTDPDYCHAELLGQPGPVVNAGTYNARSHFLYLGLVYRFGT